MHVRVSTKRRGDKVYRYAQLVQSYRRADGMPAHRVLASFGSQPEAVIQTLRAAFRAAHQGEALLAESQVAELLSGSTVANLRYLDLAVLRDCWEQWELSALLEELAGPSEAKLPFAQVILALVLQRCAVPGSKLAATRWVPKTALPELLGFTPSAFENTRVHRALEQLHAIDHALQPRLVEAYSRRDGAFFALFMDATDTWFEGIGAPMAELTRTKTGMPHKRCLSIVLLVNDRGFPLRWSVQGGKTKDWSAMGDLLRQIRGASWLERTLIVFDRAMGNRSTVAELKESGLYFLTAAHSNAIESYTTKLPSQAFANVRIEGTDASYEADIKRVAEAARRSGLMEIHPRLFALDLGVCLPACEQQETPTNPKTSRRRRRGLAHQLRRARAIEARRCSSDPPLSQAEVAPLFGISPGRVGQLLSLLRLSPHVQRVIETKGEDLPLTEKEAWALLRLDPEAQLAALDAQVADRDEPTSTASSSESDLLGELRLVAYFNPRLFVDIRRRTSQHCVDLQARVDELNAELAAAKRSRKREPTYRKFSRELERLNYLDTFDISLDPYAVTSAKGASIASFQGQITRKATVWARKRKYDGFVLLLGHPRLPHSGVDLVQSYRDKDRVEKGFQTIKSVCDLRPLFHYTDPKVQAHVTLCMLGLLLQRTLEQRLRRGGLELSANECIEILQASNLNLRNTDADSPLYDITLPGPDRTRILQALNLTQLTNDGYMRPRLTPRPTPTD